MAGLLERYFPGLLATRVTGADWNVHRIQNPVLSTWNFNLSPNDTMKLFAGFRPAEMEDRWMISADDPDNSGIFIVHLYRSWTSQEVFQIMAKMTLPDVAANQPGPGAEVKCFTWEHGLGNLTEYDAKQMVITVLRGVLGCDLEYVL